MNDPIADLKRFLSRAIELLELATMELGRDDPLRKEIERFLTDSGLVVA